MNIKISDGNDVRYRDIYDKYYNIKPKNSDQYNAMNTFLGSFNVSNLYEFLYSGTSIKSPQNLPCDVLRLRAKEKKKKSFFARMHLMEMEENYVFVVKSAFQMMSPKDYMTTFCIIIK